MFFFEIMTASPDFRENNNKIMVKKQEFLNDVRKNGKVVKWDIHKSQSKKLASSFDRLGNDKKAWLVNNCANYLEFKVYEDGLKDLTHAEFCKVRLCPMCAWRRSIKLFVQTSRIMEFLANKNFRYIFLTLTQKNVTAEQLPDELDRLFYAFEKFCKNKRFKALSKGWFRCLEITHNFKKFLKDESDVYHPHFHMVIAVNESYFTDKAIYISQKEWANMWQKALGVDYIPQVDVRSVKSDNKDCKVYKKSVAELSKYTVKVQDYIIEPFKEYEKTGLFEPLKQECEKITDGIVETLDKALFNRRLVAYGGEFKKAHKLLNLDDVLDGDLINVDGQEIRSDLFYVLETYRWQIGLNRYVKI